MCLGRATHTSPDPVTCFPLVLFPLCTSGQPVLPPRVGHFALFLMLCVQCWSVGSLGSWPKLVMIKVMFPTMSGGRKFQKDSSVPCNVLVSADPQGPCSPGFCGPCDFDGSISLLKVTFSGVQDLGLLVSAHSSLPASLLPLLGQPCISSSHPESLECLQGLLSAHCLPHPDMAPAPSISQGPFHRPLGLGVPLPDPGAESQVTTPWVLCMGHFWILVCQDSPLAPPTVSPTLSSLSLPLSRATLAFLHPRRPDSS